MVLHLAERLDVPLRERNVLLVAAGFAPVFPRAAARRSGACRRRASAVDLVLKGHEPYPALAVDRHWTLVAHNAAVPPLLAGVDAVAAAAAGQRAAAEPASRRARAAHRQSGRMARASADAPAPADRRRPADAVLVELLRRARAPIRRRGAQGRARAGEHDYAGVVVPLQLHRPTPARCRSSRTTTVFGTPVDITLSELALESFFPADAATAEALRALAGM